MAALEELKYPIGTFSKPEIISEKDIQDWVAALAHFPIEMEKRVQNLSQEQLRWCYRPDGWTIKQVVHHCADSHMNSFIRFKLALTEDLPIIKPYEEQLWANLPDGNADDITASLQLISALHKKWVLLLKTFTIPDYSRQFVHPASQKVYRLDEAIGIYAWHGKHHNKHIEQALFYENTF